ncbi:MAG: hypothetical protein ABI784_09850 [Ginsengibacter sp.]
MKEITINIPDESSNLLIELVERLGGNVDKKERRYKSVAKANNKVPKKVAPSIKKKKKEVIDHTYLFGKWKDFDIDARKLRQESW